MIITVSSILLPVITFYALFAPTNGQYDEGDACSVSSVPRGLCTTLTNCPTVYNQLLAGSPPKELCGFSGFDPIVCCPLTGHIGSTPTPTTTTAAPEPEPEPDPESELPPSEENNVVGTRAAAKCAEYARAVYTLEIPPTLSGNRQPVNRSVCAVKSRKLIVGGKKADPKEFPHMTAIGFEPSVGTVVWKCGGSLISDKFVMSAAHCSFSSAWGKAAWARVGDLNLESSGDDAKPQDRRIVERIRHPEYKRPAEYHDIALFRLETPVRLDAWTRPACLPTAPPETDASTANAIATGWGRVDWADEEGSSDLLKVTLGLVPRQLCDDRFRAGGAQDQKLHLGIVDEWQICAGEVGKDTCQGDSGGPLSIYNTDHECMYTVIGVTSLGRLCGSIIPGVYTRVYHYLSWIESVVWPGK